MFWVTGRRIPALGDFGASQSLTSNQAAKYFVSFPVYSTNRGKALTGAGTAQFPSHVVVAIGTGPYGG